MLISTKFSLNIKGRNPVAASELAARVEHLAQLIGHYPLMGKRTKRTEFRQVAFGNYLLVYKVLADEVLICYVRHIDRHPMQWLPGSD